ncbi:MAG: putative Ig domain-containing protein, partial [Planctomycetaceae bacterium]|nr:putative Ig domain-containing protein [Planctomycetaceae bacterium]
MLSNGSLVALELTEVPGDQFDEVTYRFELTEGQATFTEFGVFTLDADGLVGGVAPGGVGFEQAVLDSANREALMVGGVATGNAVERTYVGGTRLGIYFCQESVATFSGHYVSTLSQTEDTIQVGWDESAPLASNYGPPSPRWFDDVLMTISVQNSVRNERVTLNAIADQAVLEDRDFELTVTVNESARDVSLLRFQLDEAPDGATIDAETGLFTFPASNDRTPGVYNVTVRVFDSTDPTIFDTETFSIVVVNVDSLDSARLTLFVDSSPVSLDDDIGIQSDGTFARALT